MPLRPGVKQEQEAVQAVRVFGFVCEDVVVSPRSTLKSGHSVIGRAGALEVRQRFKISR
jgi:hypothetical protein